MSKFSNTRKKQLLLILVGVVFLVALMYMPTSKSSSNSDNVLAEELLHEADHDHEHEHEFEENSEAQEVSKSKSKLSPELAEQFERIESKAKQVADIDTKLNLYDSLISMSIKNNVPSFVAQYSKQKAQAVPTENNWLLAGDNYFKAFRLSKNQAAPMIKGAVKCYEEVLMLNESNLTAQTALGVAYVEGAAALGVMPMKGIGMLKDVLNVDPENIDALTNLGYFAIQSGQYDKAIDRFETVLRIDPENAEAYIYLTDVYLSQDKIEKGIETLEKYKSMVNDPLVAQQVDEYILELKNK